MFLLIFANWDLLLTDMCYCLFMPSQQLIHIKTLIHKFIFLFPGKKMNCTNNSEAKGLQSRLPKILWNKSVLIELNINVQAGQGQNLEGVRPPCLPASNMSVRDLMCKPLCGYTRRCICLCIRTLIKLHFFFIFALNCGSQHWRHSATKKWLPLALSSLLVHSIYIYRTVTF